MVERQMITRGGPQPQPRRRHQHRATTVLWLSVVGAAACQGAASATGVSSYYTDAGLPTIGQGGAAPTSGIPCPVADVLTAHCVTCHGNPPAQSVPISLLTYADLTGSSPVDPAATVAQRAVVRMQDGQHPMPPGPSATAAAADIATIQDWINAGYPKGDCGADGGTNPFNTPPVCSSGAYWQGGEDSGDLMHPGRACNTCHLQNGEGETPIFTLAGTVYPTAHEPNECIATGLNGAATVVVYDSSPNHNAYTLYVNANGNFTLTQAGFVFPYTAKVVYQGRERPMNASQTNGDCNGCHTQDGANGAPGRILLP